MNKRFIWLISVLVIIILLFSCYFLLKNKKQEPFSYQDSINLAGEWFLHNQNEEFLYYEYDVKNKTYSENRHALREIASLWSVALLANRTKDKEMIKLQNKGFSYFERYFEYENNSDFYYIHITDDILLGYSAFLILSLLEMEHPKKAFYLEKFANSIIANQNSSGDIKTVFFSDKVESKDYYPGEALFSLMMLYNYKPNPAYINVAEKAFPYYRDYWRKNKNTAFVPWQSRAYYLLYQLTDNSSLKSQLKDFVFEINDYMINYHKPKNKENCSNFDLSRGIVTSVYVEGVLQAYKLAKQLNDSRELCYKNFILEGCNATLALQVKDNSYGEKARGGFLGNTNVFTQRVDRNQHSILAFVEARDLGLIN
jgi:hypothetical protein